MSFYNTSNNSNNQNKNEFITSDPGAAAGVEIVAAEEPTLFAPTASDAEAGSEGEGLWLQNVFGGGVELSMSMRNDENEEESSAASTRPLGSASSFIAKNKKIILFALTGLFVFAVAIGASQVAKNKRMISSAAVSAAKAPKFSKEPKIGSKAPKVTKAPKTAVPSMMPSDTPSTYPSDLPSDTPSLMPSGSPSVSVSPSEAPSAQPSVIPSSFPSLEPSSSPSASPSLMPSSMPSESPSESPSAQPSVIPSASPSLQPSSSPSAQPSTIPSASPSLQPSSTPSFSPSISEVPSENPSKGCAADPDNGIIVGRFEDSVDRLTNPDGRLQRGGQISSCSNLKPYPDTRSCTGGGCRYLTFGPFSRSDSGCVRIYFNRGTCVSSGKSSVFLAAYNQAFNSNDLSAGYVGDMRDLGKFGFSIPYESGDEISFMAQAEDDSPLPCDFSFYLEWTSFDSFDNVNGTFTGSDPRLPSRLRRTGGPSTCDNPKAYQGEQNCNDCQYLTFGPFSRSGYGCLQILFDRGTCVGGDRSSVHLAAYKDTFNASDLQVGYLGDMGALTSTSFEVGYEAGDEIYMMAQAESSESDCDFSFDLNWGVCTD